MERLNDHDFHQRIAAEAGPCLVVFTTPFCGTCRAVKTLLADLELRRPELRAFEIDAGDGAGAVADLEVFHLPSLFLYVAGRFHAPIDAEPRREALEAALDRALAGPPGDPP